MRTLKQLRKEKRLTQAELAKLSGISKKTIERWEHSNHKPLRPSSSTLEALSKGLNESVSTILVSLEENRVKKKEIFDDSLELIDLVMNELKSLQDDMYRSNERYEDRIEMIYEKCIHIKYPEPKEK